MSKSKRLVYVSEDILEEIMEAARSEGKPVGDYVEEALKQALKARKLGYNPEKAMEILEAAHLRSVLGGAYIPLEVLNHLIEACKDMERLKEKWFESGQWHGKYLKEKFKDPIQAFKALLEATRWDLTEVEAKNEGDKIKLRLVSTILSREGTELLHKYVEGAISSMGYKTVKSEHMKGLIILEIKPDKE